MTFKDGPATENKYFDQRSCGKVIRIGAVACAVVLAGEVVFFALVDPSHSYCGGWKMPGKNGDGSIWGLVGAVSLWAAWIGYVAIKWDTFARWIVERLERDERLAESDTGTGWKWSLTNVLIHRARARVFYFHMIELRGLLICVLTGSVLFCALPLQIVTVACLNPMVAGYHPRLHPDPTAQVEASFNQRSPVDMLLARERGS
jgi:hypothetical protein